MHRRCTLVVEDDPVELETILRALAAHNFVGDIVIAQDGYQAVNALYAQRRPIRADLLIIDADARSVRELQLPVLTRAQALTRESAIVTLVGDVHDLWRARGGRLVSDWFVRKPTCARALSAAITAACALHEERVCSVNGDDRRASRRASRRSGGGAAARSRAASWTSLSTGSALGR
jgi:DNA-binding response OmpR family regulator